MRLFLLAALSVALSAQTKVDLGHQSQNVDFTLFSVTKPVTLVSTLPATCAVGQMVWNTTATAGQNLYLCTATNTWTQLIGSSATGTVTSVGLSMPGIFNISGSPVTTSGTLGVTLATQSANTFWAAPNGTIGTPTFRNIVVADVPTLNQNTTGNAATATALASTPTLCSTGYAPIGILANGNATGCASIGSGGGVSSVGLSLPTSVFTLSGTPVTSSGTLTAVFASQSANYAWMAPNGSSGAPTFRAIVAADIPTLNQNTTGNAATATALAATPTLCPTGQAPTGILANGNATACAAIGGGGSLPGTTNGDTYYYNGSATVRLAGPTGAQTYALTETGTGSAPAAPVWVAQYAFIAGCGTTVSTSGANVSANVVNPTRNVSGTSDNITYSTDCNGLVTYTSGSSVAIALPQPGIGGLWTTGQKVTVKGYSASLVVTPSGSSIGIGSSGAAFTVPTGGACDFVSDGTNWQLGQNCSAGGGSGSVTSVGLALPSSIFAVSGSPVTSSGTLTAAFATGQTANRVIGTDGSGNVGLEAITAAMLPTATSSAKGIVQGDGSTVVITSGTISCATGTATQLGCVSPDNFSISASSGVLSVTSGYVNTGGSYNMFGNFTWAGTMRFALPLTYSVGTAIALGTSTNVTIAPSAVNTHVTGTGSIALMTPPGACSVVGYGCEVHLIADGAWSINSGTGTGAFKNSLSATTGNLYIFDYDNATGLWYGH